MGTQQMSMKLNLEFSRRSKVLVLLFLQVVKYREEGRREGGRKGRKEGSQGERGRGKVKGRRRGREGKKRRLKTPICNVNSCNSVEKEQTDFKVTHNPMILILDYNVKLQPPILFFLLIVSEIVIPKELIKK